MVLSRKIPITSPVIALFMGVARIENAISNGSTVKGVARPIVRLKVPAEKKIQTTKKSKKSKVTFKKGNLVLIIILTVGV